MFNVHFNEKYVLIDAAEPLEPVEDNVSTKFKIMNVCEVQSESFKVTESSSTPQTELPETESNSAPVTESSTTLSLNSATPHANITIESRIPSLLEIVQGINSRILVLLFLLFTLLDS